MSKARVLFLCTINSARSQMAEGLLRRLGGECYEVYSAGLLPQAIDPMTRWVMAERGIDISRQRSKPLSDYLGRIDFDYVITLCGPAERQCPSVPDSGVHLYWPFPDPVVAGGTKVERLGAFRDVRNALEARIRHWLADAEA